MHTPLAERNQFFGMQGRITQRFQLSGPTLYLTSGGGVAYGTGGVPYWFSGLILNSDAFAAAFFLAAALEEQLSAEVVRDMSCCNGVTHRFRASELRWVMSCGVK